MKGYWALWGVITKQVKPGKCFRLFTKWSYEHELDDDNATVSDSWLSHFPTQFPLP